MPRFLHVLLVAALAALPALAADPIKIGEFGSLTGKEAAWGQSAHQGMRLAVEELNARGGILGQPLQLCTEDNQSKQGESATGVKKLITRDRVVAIVGEIASIRTLEAAPVAQQAHVPLIAPGAVNARITQTGDYVFRICFIDSFQGAVLAKFAHETLHARRLAVLTSANSAYSVSLAKVFRERYLAAGGTIVAEHKYNEGDKDFRAQLTALKAAQPDALLIPGYYTEAALICAQARQLGLTLPVLGGDGWDDPALITLGGPAVEGTYFCAHYSADNPSPEVRGFNERYLARWHAAPGAYAALSYDAIHVLADALTRAGSTDAKALRDALAATKDFPAVTGHITIDAQRNASKSAVMLTVKDGQYQFVSSVAP